MAKAEAEVRFTFEAQDIVVNIASLEALEQAVRARFGAGEGFALATINLDHLDKLKGDTRFRAAYGAQDFVVADGNPVVWLSRLARRPVALMPGADLVVPLAGWARDCGARVALVGTTEPALNAAACRLTALVPGLEIVTTIAPPMGFEPSGDAALQVLDALEESGAGLVLLALGAPKQEIFAAHGRAVLPGVGFASIGAGLDFLAGTQRRAPRWIRALAMEWLWRALSDPRRLGRRYGRSLLAFPGHALRAWRGRVRR